MNDAGATEAAASPPTGAAGAMLLSERRRQGLSLGDISRQLKLSVRQVEALERDDYSGYKSPVFIHGFIRNYAKLLGLDPEPLIRATDSMLYPPQAPAPAPVEPVRKDIARAEKKKFPLVPAIVVVVVGVIAVGMVGGKRGQDAGHGTPVASSREKDVAPAKAAAEARSAAEPKADAEGKPAKEAKPELKSPESKPVEAKPAEPKIAEARPAEAKPAEPRAVPRPEAIERRPAESGGAIAAETGPRITVRMVFEQDSWVEIKDRSGNTIFGQLNTSGSVRRVSGEPPLAIVVGNAAGVRLYQGDKSVDLGPHTRVDVARLTLE